MDIPTRREGEEFGDSKVRSGESPNVEDVLRKGARASRAHDSGAQRGDDAWREDARRKIDDAYAANLRGESLPGEELIDWLRMRRESRRNSGL